MRVGTPGFVGARLTEARQARGLSQIGLAALARLKAQSICHYEQNRQSPSPEAFDQLCAALALPHRFFLHCPPLHSRHNICFDSLDAEGRTLRLAMARRLGWLKQIAVCVRRHCEFPGVALHSIASEPEEAARGLREQLGLAPGPVEDLISLLEGAGSIVAVDRGSPDPVTSCAQWDGGIPWILLGRSQNTAHVRYRLAHQLGRLVLRPDMSARADVFARAFLMPREPFADDVWAPTLDALVSINKQWGVPLAMMIERCGEIGKFDARQARRALTALARKGWLHEHSAEEPLKFAPSLLGRTIRHLTEHGNRDAHSLLNEMALSPADVEDLTGLPRGYFSSESETLRVQTPNVVIAQVR